MPTIVNPMDAFKTFEPALKSGQLNVQMGTVDPTLLMTLDEPTAGEWRMTYARMHGESVGAIAIILPAEPFKGRPVFQIGYAVPQHLRKRGLAKDVAHAAINEFTAGMARNGIKSFYIEAIVGVKNIGSQKVAAHVIGGDPENILDEHSGEAALQYMRKVDAD
jgi:predicted acetyltransferase